MNSLCRMLLLLPVTCFAVVWYVHPDSAMNNIDGALDSCSQNDTVLVGPGIYYENIWWPTTKGICLISEYGPDTTIIDVQQSTRTLYIPPDGADSLAFIKGLTIRNGKVTTGNNGGGIYCLRDGFTIEGNTITQNQASFGGGIACFNYQTHLIIKDNTITNNTSNEGAGIFLQLSSATILPRSIMTILGHNSLTTSKS